MRCPWNLEEKERNLTSKDCQKTKKDWKVDPKTSEYGNMLRNRAGTHQDLVRHVEPRAIPTPEVPWVTYSPHRTLCPLKPLSSIIQRFQTDVPAHLHLSYCITKSLLHWKTRVPLTSTIRSPKCQRNESSKPAFARRWQSTVSTTGRSSFGDKLSQARERESLKLRYPQKLNDLSPSPFSDTPGCPKLCLVKNHQKSYSSLHLL